MQVGMSLHGCPSFPEAPVQFTAGWVGQAPRLFCSRRSKLPASGQFRGELRFLQPYSSGWNRTVLGPLLRVSAMDGNGATSRTAAQGFPPFLLWRNSLVGNETSQLASISHHDDSAETFHAKSSAAQGRFSFKFELKHTTLGSCSNTLRRGKLRHQKATTILSFNRDPVSLSLSRITLQREEPYRFKSGHRSSRLVHHSRKTSWRERKGDFRKDLERTERSLGRRYFAVKGVAADTRGPDDAQKENVLDDATDEAGCKSVGSDGAERDVEVKVEAVSWRERQIRASVCVEASHQRVWEVLTGYERLVEFIPNLVKSERIPSPHPQRIWLLQQGMQTAMYWHIEAHVVLDLEELPYAENGKELRFLMVDGDFKHYEGRWYLRPGPRPGTTNLHYEVNVIPKLFFPAAFLERIITGNLPINLRAIARRAESEPSEWHNIVHPPKLSFKQPTPSPVLAYFNKLFRPSYSEVIPATAPQGPSITTEDTDKETSTPSGLEVDTSFSLTDKGILQKLSDKSWFGSKTCQFEGDSPCTVDEVHLRRLDDLLENGGVHRRVVVAITVESPVKDVWNVLTDYECLPNFIPNLASCKIISRTKHHVRLVQEGCKCIMFMVLHARAVLDLWEKPDNEIIFQQVEGDFASLQGKWNLEPLGTQHTLLKYVVDVKMHKHCVLAEAIIEEVTYVDLPENLCAVRAQVELRKEKAVHHDVEAPAVQETLRESRKQRPPKKSSSDTLPEGQRRFRVAGLQKDFRVLEEQLFAFIREHGREGYMPMRSELREHKRVDLEKAISRMGGFSTIATRLNLSQQRRPRGYWDHFQNVHKEILMFQTESGMDKSYMPTRNSLHKAGRHDVARALEKWGGVREVARLMGLKVRRVGLQSSMEIMASVTSNITDNDSISQRPLKISLPSKPKKWVEMKQEVGSSDKRRM